MPGEAVPVQSRMVFDGDTLELIDGRRVRLIGINAPEIGRKGRPSEPFARAAEQRLRALAFGNRLYLLEGQEPRDRYGRTLAYLFDSRGHSIEAQLLSEGLGFAIAVPPNLNLVACHRAAEQSARSAGRGLWTGTPVLEAGKLSRGGFQLIRGSVRKVEKAGRFWWLALDGDVVLRVHSEDHSLLLGSEPGRLAGQTIEARGWVIDRRGQRSMRDGHQRYMLPIRHASMLHITD